MSVPTASHWSRPTLQGTPRRIASAWISFLPLPDGLRRREGETRFLEGVDIPQIIGLSFQNAMRACLAADGRPSRRADALFRRFRPRTDPQWLAREGRTSGANDRVEWRLSVRKRSNDGAAVVTVGEDHVPRLADNRRQHECLEAWIVASV